MEPTKKLLSVKDNRVFARVYRKGGRVAGRCLALYCLKSRTGSGVRLGITVSKDRGGAVVRNRIKRRVREAFRAVRPFIKEDYNIVIVARQAAVDARFTVIKSELRDLLTRAALLDETL